MGRIAPETPILVLDDSAAIRARVKTYLGRLGHTNVRTAANMKEGLEAFREQQSEVIFLDLVIDQERGADFAVTVLDERPLVDIVVMTALPSTHDQVTAAISHGARAYLRKPVELEGIRKALALLEEDDEEEPNDAEAKAEPESLERDASYV